MRRAWQQNPTHELPYQVEGAGLKLDAMGIFGFRALGLRV